MRMPRSKILIVTILTKSVTLQICHSVTIEHELMSRSRACVLKVSGIWMT